MPKGKTAEMDSGDQRVAMKIGENEINVSGSVNFIEQMLEWWHDRVEEAAPSNPPSQPE